MRMRSCAHNDALRPPHVLPNRTLRCIHQGLRQTPASFRKLIRRNHVFAWLAPKLQAPVLTERSTDTDHVVTGMRLQHDPDGALPRQHRGLPAEHARRATERKFDSLTSHPPELWSLVRPEHYNPPPRRSPHVDDDSVGPVTGTDFSWEDGNGIQKGWGGRTGH